VLELNDSRYFVRIVACGGLTAVSRKDLEARIVPALKRLAASIGKSSRAWIEL